MGSKLRVYSCPWGGARKPGPLVAPGERRTLLLQTIVSLVVWVGGGFCWVVEAVVWVGWGGSGWS